MGESISEIIFMESKVAVSGRVKAEAVRVEPEGEAICVEAEASAAVSWL
jgi:hypothetical protein